jgi:hypothetical protein
MKIQRESIGANTVTECRVNIEKSVIKSLFADHQHIIRARCVQYTEETDPMIAAYRKFVTERKKKLREDESTVVIAQKTPQAI